MMFKNFFRRRKKEKKKEEELKKKEKVDDPKGSVGELLNIGKDVTVIKTSFPDVKLGVKFSKGEVATISDAARKLGLCEGDYFWRVDGVDVVRATSTELATLSIDERIIYLVKHSLDRPLQIDFLRRNEEKMDKIRRTSLSNSKDATKRHHTRTKSIDDAVPSTKEERQKAAMAGLRKSLLRKKSKTGLVISGPHGAVRRKVELPQRRKSRVEKKRIALPGLSIYDSTTVKKNLVPVFMRHDNFTQSESQVALTFKHELRVPKTMTVRQLIENLNTVSDGKNGMEVSNFVCLSFNPGKLTTRTWPDIIKKGKSIDHVKLADKLLLELLPKIKIIMVDVMSHWDADFAIDFGESVGSKSEKNDGDALPPISPVIDQSRFKNFDRLNSSGWGNSFDGSSVRSDSHESADMSSGERNALSFDEKIRTESDFVIALDVDVNADAFDDLDWGDDEE